MQFVESLIDTTEGLMAFVGSMLKQDLENYCTLETADSKNVLVMSNGELVSVVAINGTRNVVGQEEFEQIENKLWRSLQSYFSSGSHAVQFYFERDQEGVDAEISARLAGARQSAKAMSIDIGDIFDDIQETYKKHCSIEKNFMVLITKPGSMTKSEIKRFKAEQKKLYKHSPPSLLGQNMYAVADNIRDKHQSFVSSMVNDLSVANINAKLLDVHTAVREIRKTVDPAVVDENWTPYLPGDKIPYRFKRVHSNDASDVQWPRLSSQIFTRDAEEVESNFMRIGNSIYAPVFVDLAPKDPQPFSMLFNRLNNAKIPWRVSFLVENNGLDSIALKAIGASLLSFTSSRNELIYNAEEKLKEYVKKSGDSDVKLKISACTWVTNGNINTLRDRVARLSRSIEGWGVCTTNEISGDAPAGVLSSALAVNNTSIANYCAAPLRDVVGMFPITRPASPWDDGAILFRTEDGKVWPYQPGSEKQVAWIDLIFATMGSGKSVLQNKINLALCLSPGIKRLPRIAIIDIGPSSSGLISLIQEHLPENQRHLVAYHRLRMTKEYGINPFDTQLGCRKPDSQHREFLVNLLLVVLTPIGYTGPKHDAISEMAGIVIDEVYKLCDQDNRPKPYVRNISKDVDHYVDMHNIQVDRKTSWWEIVEALFKAGEVHASLLAQRFAVPVLEDCIEASRNEAIRNLYSAITVDGESIVDTFSRMISAAVREFPILAMPTTFDLGEARVVSLDLDEVARGDSDASVRQTSLMYMLARHVMAKDFYLIEEHVKDMPELYRKHHLARISEIREDIKRICMDEFHRTKKSKAVREQVKRDVREGRKWGVHVSLVSQLVDDFDDLTELATSVFILSGDQRKTIDKISEIFGLSDTVKWCLENRVHGPTKDGATFIARFKTKEHTITQMITSTLGSIEYWAFSTTAQDVHVRKKLYASLGPVAARKLLSKTYPFGVQKEAERRMTMLALEGKIMTEDESSGVLDQIGNELIKEYANLNKNNV